MRLEEASDGVLEQTSKEHKCEHLRGLEWWIMRDESILSCEYKERVNR